jgi:hypothetical protein
LLQDYSGQTKQFQAIYEEHSVGRPFIKKNYRDVLCLLESEERVTMIPPCPPRRRNTLAGHVSIRFPGSES